LSDSMVPSLLTERIDGQTRDRGKEIPSDTEQ
jgi:hypothetical protein